MSAKRPPRFVRAINEAVRERDRLEMKAVNALLSAISPSPKKRRRARPSRRRATVQ